MKILITGGAGFIGKYIVKHLLKKNNSITIFDNFSNSKKTSITFLTNQGVRVIEGDITKIKEISNAIRNQEIVIHLAAQISVNESIINPHNTFKVNVDGTKNVLFACKENHVQKIIIASSAAVYGEGFQNVKLSEESKLNPISPYGKSKAIMEQEIKRMISENDDLKYDILRFFNIFGKGQTNEYAGVITKFIQKINNNQDLEIFGDGEQTRDFVAIEDVVNAIEKSISKINKKSRIYNIASGKSTSIKKLANILTSNIQKEFGIKFLPQKNGDIRFSIADITLAKNELEYIPKYDLDKIQKMFK